MKLGEKILHELDAGTGDMLTRWIAHHIADLITRADHARMAGTAEEATHTAEQCRRAILDLWAHRTAWPNGWPPPGAKRMAEILNSIDAPTYGFQQGNGLSGLEHLHHQVLAVLADAETANEPADAVEDWLETFGQLLDADERKLMELYASRDDRAAELAEVLQVEQPTNEDVGADEQIGRTPQARRALDLARTYHETVRALIADEPRDAPTKPR
ncbi:hypothetical protein [Streptomyces erythrochromogenes]|uniref:hypothetical protein n=1 Tax=Streptomyces erythrochromogenes TaxID=285574 RepID=UPI00367CFE6A